MTDRAHISKNGTEGLYVSFRTAVLGTEYVRDSILCITNTRGFRPCRYSLLVFSYLVFGVIE